MEEAADNPERDPRVAQENAQANFERLAEDIPKDIQDRENRVAGSIARLPAEHMQKAGFRVKVRNSDDLNPLKEQLGVPYGKGSCHTAEVGGYFVEGHVPVEDIKRLLTDKPDAKGLAVPGMPLGSPGMEVPDGTVQPYAVVPIVATELRAGRKIHRPSKPYGRSWQRNYVPIRLRKDRKVGRNFRRDNSGLSRPMPRDR